MTPKATRDFINNNRSLFVLGNTFSESLITSACAITPPNYAGVTYQQGMQATVTYQCEKVRAQNKVNRILAIRGLYMSQSNRGLTYTIKTLPGSKRKVKTFAIDASRKAFRGIELDRGVKAHKGIWKHVANHKLPTTWYISHLALK